MMLYIQYLLYRVTYHHVTSRHVTSLLSTRRDDALRTTVYGSAGMDISFDFHNLVVREGDERETTEQKQQLGNTHTAERKRKRTTVHIVLYILHEMISIGDEQNGGLDNTIERSLNE